MAGLLLLVALVVAERMIPVALRPTPPPLRDGIVRVFFTTPTLVYPDIAEERVMPDYEAALVADINAAQHQVDVAAFEYNLMSVAEALLHARKRGVLVRLALDREVLHEPEMALWAGLLEHAGIPIAWEDSTAFLHSKFLVIDHTLLWTGSWNVTNNGTYRNNNNLLRITLPPVVLNYTVEFEQMFNNTFGNDKITQTPFPLVEYGDRQIETYFAPQDGVAVHVLERLERAQHSIRFLAFAFTSSDIAGAMIARRQAGVLVQGVFERRNARGTGSVLSDLRGAGATVYEDGNCYTMHHKVIIIDEATVITGSYNFTGRAEDTNDENLLIIDDPLLAQQYIAEFERVYAQAQEPMECRW